MVSREQSMGHCLQLVDSSLRDRCLGSTHLPRHMWGNTAPPVSPSSKEPVMLNQVKGLHHVTSMASDARRNNEFFTHKLGLRRVKKTGNFDAPDVYHLYYADEFGTPGSVMTYFPFPDIGKGRHGVGEVGTTVFSVPEGSLGYWEERLTQQGVTALKRE